MFDSRSNFLGQLCRLLRFVRCFYKLRTSTQQCCVFSHYSVHTNAFSLLKISIYSSGATLLATLQLAQPGASQGSTQRYTTKNELKKWVLCFNVNSTVTSTLTSTPSVSLRKLHDCSTMLLQASQLMLEVYNVFMHLIFLFEFFCFFKKKSYNQEMRNFYCRSGTKKERKEILI